MSQQPFAFLQSLLHSVVVKGKSPGLSNSNSYRRSRRPRLPTQCLGPYSCLERDERSGPGSSFQAFRTVQSYSVCFIISQYLSQSLMIIQHSSMNRHRGAGQWDVGNFVDRSGQENIAPRFTHIGAKIGCRLTRGTPAQLRLSRGLPGRPRLRCHSFNRSPSRHLVRAACDDQRNRARIGSRTHF